MLSHKVLNAQDSGNLATYYGDAADDYYAKEGEAQVWQGKGAEELGLDGEVTSVRFRDMLHGRVVDPRFSVRNTTRLDSKDRLGLDLTFSAPKSVSVQGLVGGDAAMIEAHDLAVTRVLAQVETLAEARQRVEGKTVIERTGNLVIAKFRHETTRAQDPEIHTHAIVMNVTKRADGTWRALNNDPIVKSTKYLGALYRSELAMALRERGYELRHGKDGTFELASMSEAQVRGFSKRSVQIEQYLAERGIHRATATAAQRQEAALATRDRKPAEVDRETLFKEWKSRAHELGINYAKTVEPTLAERLFKQAKAAVGFSEPSLDAARLEAAKRAVTYAVNHMTEREAIITRRALLDMALKHAVGETQISDVESVIAQRIESGALVAEDDLYTPAVTPNGEGETKARLCAGLVEKGMPEDVAIARVEAAIARGSLLPKEARYATAAAVAREASILAIERDGRGSMPAIMTPEAAAAHFADKDLKAGQQGAATMILSTTNRVTGIEGLAGTGKSHMLEYAKKQIEAEGFNVRALAPYSAQVRALKALGVQANTVASFLKARKKGIDSQTVLVVDEAGTMPANDMARLLAIAEAEGARVVLVGDRAQTQAIQAGRPFDQLIARGMSLSRMDEIQRQKNPKLKEAVEFAAVGQTKKSLSKVEHLTEVPNASARRALVAAEFLKLTPEERQNTLIVSGTNEARREINNHVREGLGTVGKGQVFTLFIRRDTTQEERRHARNYAPGDVVQPERDYQGLKRHALYTVVRALPGNRLEVAGAEGRRRTFVPTRAELSVYEPERSELAKGDLIRITRNDAARDLANGDRFVIEDVTAKLVTISNGQKRLSLPADKGLHVDHAHATTVHSSQGLTCDRTLIDAETTSRTTAKDVYYVALSRARYEARVFTDSLKNLPAAIARQHIKTAALDLRRGPDAGSGLGRRERSLGATGRQKAGLGG